VTWKFAFGTDDGLRASDRGVADEVVAGAYDLRAILAVMAESTAFSATNLGNVFLVERTVLGEMWLFDTTLVLVPEAAIARSAIVGAFLGRMVQGMCMIIVLDAALITARCGAVLGNITLALILVAGHETGTVDLDDVILVC
jgi:hypothetical protein